MKRQLGLIVCMICLLLGACKNDKVALFNGKDLTGWKCVTDPKSDVSPDQTFMVKYGVIAISGTPFGYMRTTTKYADYTLHTEWRWTADPADSGIYLLVQEGDKVWPTGIQCQMQGNSLGVLMGGIPMKGVEDRNGFYVKKLSYTELVEKPAGEWNETEITCSKGHLSVTINGVLVNEADCQESEGYIALQSEGGPIEFRNVYLTKE